MTDFLTDLPPQPAPDYDSLPGLRWSRLSKLRRSPKAYREHVQERTSHLDMGAALHAIVSGERAVVAYPGPVRRGKEWDKFQRDHAADIVLTKRELDVVERMGGALLKHDEARELMRSAVGYEQIVTWHLGVHRQDAVGRNRACKAKLDGVLTDGFYDLKSTRDIGHRAWGRDIAARGYVHQLAWYRRGTCGGPVFIIAVENVSPYDVRVDSVDDDLLDAADREIDRLLLLLDECERTNNWPGVAPGVGQLSAILPPWWCDDDAVSEITLGGEAVET